MQGMRARDLEVGNLILFLSMNWFRLHGHRGLLECLREGWMCVRRPGNILGAGTILHGQHRFSDHLSSVGTWKKVEVRMRQTSFKHCD